MQAGQTYGDVKRQLVRVAQEAADKLARAVGEADDQRKVRWVGGGAQAVGEADAEDLVRGLGVVVVSLRCVDFA